MRILFVHSGADLYGSGRSLLRLSSRLVQDGHAALVVLPYEGALRSELEKSGVQVVIHHGLPVVDRQRFRGAAGLAGLLLSVPVSVVRLLGLIARFQADVIHTNTAVILSPGIAARLARVPHVWHVREFFGEFQRLWRWYQWFVDRFADKIVCVSTPVAQQFDRRLAEERVVVIHNGFPKDEFASVPAERVNAFRHRFSLQDGLIVGVVGRIKLGRKGQDTFVQAAALLKAKFPNARFVLIGSPFTGNEDHLQRLTDMIASLGLAEHVTCTGDVDDIKAAYAALDISVLPSGLPEPFGGVVIESMAMGKPVIGTRLGGTIEQIEDGVTGFLVEPNDPQQLAQAMERLLGDADLRRRMGEASRARFLQCFEFEAFYPQVLSLYQQVCSLRTSRGRRDA